MAAEDLLLPVTGEWLGQQTVKHGLLFPPLIPHLLQQLE
jgi:hypothetical protein